MGRLLFLFHCEINMMHHHIAFLPEGQGLVNSRFKVLQEFTLYQVFSSQANFAMSRIGEFTLCQPLEKQQ